MSLAHRAAIGLTLAVASLAATQALKAQLRYADFGRSLDLGAWQKTIDTRVADFNGDGFLDLSHFEDSVGVRVTLGDGSGAYRVAAMLDFAVGFHHEVADFDGDGDIDILVGGVMRGNFARWLWLYANDGNARFTDVSKKVPEAVLAATVISVDIDRDGDLDLVIPRGRTGFRLFENNRGAFRSAWARLRTNPPTGEAHAAYDVDRDGRLDLVSVLPSTVNILFQNASGDFARLVQVPHNSRATTIALADVDKDGDTDFFLGGAAVTSAKDAFFEGAGSTWRDASATRLPASAQGRSAGQARFVDIDEDGDLDLLAPKLRVRGAGTRVHIYLNNGRGTFRDVTTAVLGTKSSIGSPLIADLDGDGDVDIARTTSISSNHVLRNLLSVDRSLLRHVAMPPKTKIGTKLSIDLYARAGFAPPGQVSVPLVSLARATRAIPVHSFGSLGLDPASLVVLYVRPHSIPKGEVKLDLQIPKDARLVGKKLYAQALVLHVPAQPSTWRLTNVCATTLTR